MGRCFVLSIKNNVHMMSTQVQSLLKELGQEAQTTRKMLSLVPANKYDWQPHPKSMTVRRLATHLAELPGWITLTLNTDELDFATNPYKEEVIHNNTELMAYFENQLASGKARLEQSSDDELFQPWTMRSGDQVYFTSPKSEMLRTTYCQIVHHRAQLGVFLRLLDVPIPGSYGPSYDELNPQL